MAYRIKIVLFAVLLALNTEAMALGGDFSLSTARGETYALSDSRGRAVILSFGFTACPDVCPTTLATIAAALQLLGPAAQQVDALFVTLDPERDTPERLHDYTRYFHPAIRGLIGSEAQLREVTKAYRVFYAFNGDRSGGFYSLDHTASLFIIDTRGRLQQMVPHGFPPEAIAEGVRRAIAAADRGNAGDPIEIQAR